MNPSFKVSVRPLGGFAKFAPEDILTAALPTFSRAFDDVQLLEGPRSGRVSGRNAAYARISYTLRAKDVAVLTISEIWIVPKGAIFFMIGPALGPTRKKALAPRCQRSWITFALNGTDLKHCPDCRKVIGDHKG